MKETTRPDLNSPETFQLFAIQYWGQRVVKEIGVLPLNVVGVQNIEFISPGKEVLELTSLADITDEDAITVAEIVGYNDCEGKSFNVCYRNGHYRRWICIEDFTVTDYCWSHDYETIEDLPNVPHIVDFLRSRGYALPWLGYTVEELISAGYCQLRKEGDNG